jgi:LPS-assembly lipoprotein
LSRPGSLALLLFLGGCGFQLQGALTVPPEMERTYISTEDRHSGFYHDLRAALGAAGIDLVDSPTDATATFTISFDDTDQRVLSVSARNVPTEYEVYYTVEYSLHSGEKRLLRTQTLTLTRDYTYDSTLVLGKSREEELLREAIVDDLVRIVLKQLSAI